MKLEVRDLSCSYSKAGPPIQEYITFSVDEGEICCVLGPNGCGKSTLFKTMVGLMPALAGTVAIDGDDVSKWSPRQLSSVVAFVEQAHNPPFPYQVKDVVLLGRVNKTGRKSRPTVRDYRIVEQAMRDMGIYELKDKKYTEISGGELQLVMIAKALAQQPKMLVLDEPTAALDYGNVVRVITTIRDLAKRGFLILMTTHSPDHAFMCQSKVLLLQKDSPMKFGNAVDIINEKNIQQAYGVSVKIVEFVNTKQEIMRMCSPTF